MTNEARKHNASIYALGQGFRCETCEEPIQDGQEWLRKNETSWHVYCAKCAEIGDEEP